MRKCDSTNNKRVLINDPAFQNIRTVQNNAGRKTSHRALFQHNNTTRQLNTNVAYSQ